MNSFRSGLFFLTASLSIGNQSFLFKALDTRIVETHIKFNGDLKTYKLPQEMQPIRNTTFYY
ncbi:hypothetical protein DPV73_09315 [Leptospira mayottensis]|nr:hypothetical protein DPV73_09315 [Leptospira mayottensis]